MESIGAKRGASCAFALWRPRKECRVVVHGDDFAVLGWKDVLDWFWGKISERFERKHRGEWVLERTTSSKFEF